MAVEMQAAGVVFYVTSPLDEWLDMRPPASAPMVTQAELACLQASKTDRPMAEAILLAKAIFPGAQVVAARCTTRRGRTRWFDVSRAAERRGVGP